MSSYGSLVSNVGVKAIGLELACGRTFDDNFKLFEFLHSPRDADRLHIQKLGNFFETDPQIIIEIQSAEKSKENSVLFAGETLLSEPNGRILV